MTNQLIMAAVSTIFLIGSVQAQTPAVGDTPNAATVGQDYVIAKQRQINRQRGVTTGYAIHGRVIRGVMSD